MHLRIFLDEATASKLTQLAKRKRAKRGALIREAIDQFVARQGEPRWPDAILEFRGIADWPAFEASRAEFTFPAKALASD